MPSSTLRKGLPERLAEPTAESHCTAANEMGCVVPKWKERDLNVVLEPGKD
jgi:hypothetical protein